MRSQLAVLLLTKGENKIRNSRIFIKLIDEFVATKGLSLIKINQAGECRLGEAVGGEIVNAIGPKTKFASFPEMVLVRVVVGP
jgi:uncharacterized membrane protein YphA (DoxX/SURF4 family)